MKKEGFTLLEIMIVVAVVGLLITLGSHAFLSGMSTGREKQAAIELDMLSTAVLQLAWDTGRWPNQELRTQPGSTEIWDISGDAAGLTGADDAYDNWRGPYYDGETLDPWGNPYFFDPDYRVDGVMRIVVGSFGPNGRGRNRYDSDDIYVLLDN